MASAADTFLKISVAISLLGAAGSVGYYYAVYLPARDVQLDNDRRLDKARAEIAKRAAEERAQQERDATEQRRAAERAVAQAGYETCISRAEAVYNATWASNCKSVAERVRKQRSACNLAPTACDSIYPATDAGPNCSLPTSLASSINANLQQGKERCLQESKAGLQ
ncbi:hypothetical protein FJN17_12190 [Bradyrhizobium symbiodeficiens]|uniref:Uncharacterized protein n=1 Tax=Bradyrhizobium symbiodeficiens TaxID=1404367 RepID=A0ABX5W6M1_9BRAD|nr:hypothetical protein [Bradyrhizobium symbiodeficiens]QDF38267.1 hypothetical protein FJN17_12190 [Bradyrhizobium symbiodeficiens]